MKVALLFPNNIFTSPYLSYYLRLIKANNIEYDLFIWNRANVEEKECVPFKNQVTKNSIYSTAVGFLKFRKFLISSLKTKKHDRVIVFSCQLGILLSDYLIEHFNDKFFLDIRDYSIANKYFGRRFHRLLSHANTVTISSNGFRKWLPSKIDCILSHNISKTLLENVLVKNDSDKAFFLLETINVDTIGAIRDVESNFAFIDALKNDKNFFLNFFGKGYAIPFLREKARKESINNIAFHGQYKKEDEEELLKNTDFLCILLNDNLLSKSLTSNRIYLSALYRVPCIVNKRTEQSNIIEKYNFGIIVDRYDSLPNKIIEYKKEFNKVEFIKSCNSFLNDVKKDYEFFESKVIEFLINK